MEQSKQEVIDKILSFSYEELSNWIRSRLNGDDGYFPIYEGYETNLSDFLTDAFNHIRDGKFRDNFIDIMNDLVSELRKYTPKEIEGKKEYIYELLILCGSIKEFESGMTLFKIAKSGKLKGFKLRDTDLHLVLLTTLLTYKMGGNYRFWVEQMQDNSNKYYTNAAFYALLKHGYRLDILFKHMGLFIERFKGDVVLVFGIEALFDYHEPEEIHRRFKEIESQLTKGQKEAVNDAFIEAGYDKPYKISPEPDTQSIYTTAKPALSMVGEKKVEYRAAKTLKQKAGVIFEQMGFDVEFNRQMAGYSIDIFIKKKKTFGNKYECYICQCREGKRKVNKNEVNHFRAIREAVDGCDAIIISEKGFTKGAVEMAGEYGIELKTPDNLESDLRNFNSIIEKLIQKVR
jgi:hypothetical protein